ncbi:MAG: FxLYD domain-containing protein [Eubacterium sp.]|nr:FxLYD domain-containing protein [Candidatus Colimonas fimequi]
MKKLLAVLVSVIMVLAMCTACGSGGSGQGAAGSDVETEFTPVGSSLAIMGSVTNNSDEAVAATVTVYWFDELNEQLGYSVAEFPYIEGTDTVFDVFDFGEMYDTYDYDIQTAPVTDEARAFYDNLTIESSMDDSGKVDFIVGGGNGEKFKSDVVIVYTDENDNPVDYQSKTVKGEGTATGTFKGTKNDKCIGYRMNMIPKGLM